MKVALSKEEYSKLPEALKGKAQVQQDGSFYLETDAAFLDSEDPAKLKNALEQERKNREELGLKLKELETKMSSVDLEAAEKAKLEAERIQKELDANLIKSKDMQGMLDRFDQRMADQQAAFERQLTERDEKAKAEAEAAKNAILKVGSSALAKEIFDDLGDKFAPILQNRLSLDEGNQLIAVDESGNPISLDQFKQEILADQQYAAIISASKGSGVGDTRSVGSPVDIGDRNFNQLSPGDRTKLAREDPAKYQQLREASTPEKITTGELM